MTSWKKPPRRLAAFLLTVLVLGLFAAPARAVSQEDIDALRERISDLEEEKASYAAEIEALSDDLSSVLERKKILDARIAATREQIAATEEIIRGYEEAEKALEQDIAVTRRQLELAETRASNTYELYCRRVRALEEGGAVSYWNVLFGSESFSDLLTRLDFIGEVLSYNEDVILSYNEVCNEISSHKTELEASLSELQNVINGNRAAQEELSLRSQELKEERAAASELILEIMNDKEKQESFLQFLEQQRDATDREIAVQEAALEQQRQEEAAAREAAAREAARRSSSSGGTTTSTAPVSSNTSTPASTETPVIETGSANGSTGTGNASPQEASGGESGTGTAYAWPVNSVRINSGYGHRDEEETGGVGSTNHQGIDIGGVGYGTDVGAAASGTVIRAGDYGDGYGNCVVIKHDDGSTTLYAHMQSLNVNAGDTVGQLDKIGETGATGAATGPHLHFEIRVDGSTVDPEDYLP